MLGKLLPYVLFMWSIFLILQAVYHILREFMVACRERHFELLPSANFALAVVYITIIGYAVVTGGLK